MVIVITDIYISVRCNWTDWPMDRSQILDIYLLKRLEAWSRSPGPKARYRTQVLQFRDT